MATPTETVDHVERPPARDGRSVAKSVAAGLWRGFVALVRWVTILPRAVVRWWRRSIQARVVLGVLALSTVLAVLAGWVLLHQVKNGLLVSQRQVALPQAAAGFDTARAQLTSDAATAVCAPDKSYCHALDSAIGSLVETLKPREATTSTFAVAVIGPLAQVRPGQPSTWNAHWAGPVDIASSVPTRLVTDIKRLRPGSRWSYASLRASPEAAVQPALVVGRKIRVESLGRDFAVLYVFPLSEQESTLSVVERALFGAGAILVLLLGVIAWLVTRQVVTPVRLARRIAERLASGRLEERMHVRGEDDIARLAKSFNQMAGGLQHQIRQLEELSRVQRRFVADVSHELRTPLTTVRMATDLLYEARDDFDAPTARAAELLQNELDRFENLLTDLLEISRFDAGAAVLEPSPVDVGDVARQVIEGHRALARSRGSDITLTLPDGGAAVEADIRRVSRVVRNLVANAIEYGEGGDIDVVVTSDATSVTLVVRDHGMGLQPGEARLVFNRFWRADPARARTHGGTGLGLSIAAEDAALHGGVLDAWGRRGVGSVFRLVLPRIAGHVVRPQPLPLPEDKPVRVGAPALGLADSEDLR